jgi:hypothetical protein
VTVFASAAAMKARFSAALGRFEPLSDKRCELRTGSNDLTDLVRFLVTLDAEFVAHEPPELIAHLRQVSKRLARAGASTRG